MCHTLGKSSLVLTHSLTFKMKLSQHLAGLAVGSNDAESAEIIGALTSHVVDLLASGL